MRILKWLFIFLPMILLTGCTPAELKVSRTCQTISIERKNFRLDNLNESAIINLLFNTSFAQDTSKQYWIEQTLKNTEVNDSFRVIIHDPDFFKSEKDSFCIVPVTALEYYRNAADQRIELLLVYHKDKWQFSDTVWWDIDTSGPGDFEDVKNFGPYTILISDGYDDRYETPEEYYITIYDRKFLPAAYQEIMHWNDATYYEGKARNSADHELNFEYNDSLRVLEYIISGYYVGESGTSSSKIHFLCVDDSFFVTQNFQGDDEAPLEAIFSSTPLEIKEKIENIRNLRIE